MAQSCHHSVENGLQCCIDRGRADDRFVLAELLPEKHIKAAAYGCAVHMLLAPFFQCVCCSHKAEPTVEKRQEMKMNKNAEKKKAKAARKAAAKAAKVEEAVEEAVEDRAQEVPTCTEHTDVRLMTDVFMAQIGLDYNSCVVFG